MIGQPWTRGEPVPAGDKPGIWDSAVATNTPDELAAARRVIEANVEPGEVARVLAMVVGAS